MTILVPPAGRVPNRVLLVGEAPGELEAKHGLPFVGPSGAEQEAYLSRHGLTARAFRRTNVIQEYTPGNPDPTPAQVRHWTAALYEELDRTRPEVVLAVGRFAARWFLGEGVGMRTVHGVPCRAGEFDPGRRDRGGPNDAVIVPVFHPAAGMHSSSLRALIHWDYTQAARAIHGDDDVLDLPMPVDEHEGGEIYLDVTGAELASLLTREGPWGPGTQLALDTEGTPASPWSIQACWEAGRAYTLRTSQPDFSTGITALQSVADAGTTLLLHQASTPIGCCYDIAMGEAMGLSLVDARIWDTMYAAYLARHEPQGLKALAWRWCGMKLGSYEDVLGGEDRGKQIAYLVEVATGPWSAPERRPVLENDGSVKLYKPASIQNRARRILADLAIDKRDKDGNPVDVAARWQAAPRVLLDPVEEDLGPLPTASLDDAPLDQAVWYACQDADATFRVAARLAPYLDAYDLTRTMTQGMATLPIFYRMQKTGMLASREKFVDLEETVNADMWKLVKRISREFNGGEPFNPASHPQVRALLKRRGLQGTETTDTGLVSTSKKSIEHLRQVDPAISVIFDWREMQKVRDHFCRPTLERMESMDRAGEEVVDGGSVGRLYPIRCVFKPTRTATRRLATENPNLQQVPKRTELGKRVRKAYCAPDGWVYAAWDLSQIEVRYAAHLSGDERLCRLIREGADIHSETASSIFGIPVEELDPMEHRYPAKRIAFGVLYGIQAAGLLTQIEMMGIGGWDEARCEEMITGFYRVYPGLWRAVQETEEELERQGYVRDVWGVYRDLPGIWSPRRSARAEAVRVGFSHKVQGGAQGMIQNSMVGMEPAVEGLRRAGLGIEWALQIHDEVVFLCERDAVEVLGPVVLEALETMHGLEGMSVPVVGEGEAGQSWGEME